jgi:hypothetical protein
MMSDSASYGVVSDPANPSRNFDIVGPTVDDDIRRAIGRHGAQAVKDAIRRRTKKGRGRKSVPDWPEISEILKEDARIWLEGGDPFMARTEYSIAKEYAERCPGHSQVSTHRRMMKKLAAHRIYFTLVQATYLSDDQYPHAAHLRALTELGQIGGHRGIWETRLALAESYIADYACKFGTPPQNLTMKEIEQGSRVTLQATPAAFNFFGSLLRALPK